MKIAIVGGGAAGMMVGVSILERIDNGQNSDLQITVFERNDELGVKVAMTGGGRCNVTTGITDIDELLSKYPRGAEFLQGQFAQFGPAEITAWFEAHGAPLVEEANNRMFPASHKGRDIVRVFEDKFAQNAEVVNSKFGTIVSDIAQIGDKFAVSYETKGKGGGVSVGVKEEVFDIVVATTGGSAYAQTGSSGDGYKFAQNMGHTVTPLAPSLSSLLVEEQWVRDLSGLSLPQARLVARIDSGQNAGEFQVDGGFLFAHFGMTGPVVFALSAQIAHEEISQKRPLTVKLIIDKDKNANDWDDILREQFAQSGKQKLWQVLTKLIPKKLAPVVCELWGSDDSISNPNPKVAEIGKRARLQIAQILGDGLGLSIIGRRPGDEFVTAGGVDTSEVDPQTCQSQIVVNLYFAGEILNIDGVTGGFNLTACWTTGHTAGTAICAKLKKDKEI